MFVVCVSNPTLVSRARLCPLSFVFVCADPCYLVTLVRPSCSFTLVCAHLCLLICICLLICADPHYPATPNDSASVQPLFTLIWADPHRLVTFVSCACSHLFAPICAHLFVCYQIHSWYIQDNQKNSPL
jgi:hypothetical protein